MNARGAEMANTSLNNSTPQVQIRFITKQEQ